MEEEERETSRSVAVELDRSEDFDCDEVPESGGNNNGRIKRYLGLSFLRKATHAKTNDCFRFTRRPKMTVAPLEAFFEFFQIRCTVQTPS